MAMQGQWKWHPKSIDQEHNGSIYYEPIPGHAYAVAMQPRYASDEQWAYAAELIVRAVNAHDALVTALESVRGVISDAALTGFNCEDGDWAERLFASQAKTTAAIRLAKPASTNEEAA